MSLDKVNYLLQKKKSHVLTRFVHILEQKSLGVNFQYINTFTRIKRTISQKDFKSILEEENTQSEQQISFRRASNRYLVEHVLDLKAKRITDHINVEQYQIWKQKMNSLIILQRKDKQKKLSLQEKKIEKKSSQESTYETCLLGTLIFIIVSFIYIILKELKI